jgi:hypothetical protein
MKAKLIKIDKDNYTLFDEKGIPIGTTPNVLSNNTFSKLSKQNCDEIFGIVDVEKLAEEITKEYATLTPKAFKRGVALGVNKAMELNKDKLFTLEDMRKAFELGYDASADTYMTERKEKEFEILIQQPTEIDVEIEMEKYVKYVPKTLITIYPTGGVRPKLDSNGCIILKKI